LLVPLLAASAAFAAAPAGLYELSGRLVTPQRLNPRIGASISLFGTARPFTSTAVADANGRFRFKKLQPGLYTMSVFIRRRGEARRTVEVGPSGADTKRRVRLTWEMHDSDFVPPTSSGLYRVRATQLSVPTRAMKDYREAQKDLARQDVPSAIGHLEHAVDIAPQFSAAWNNLGTIAYQTSKFDRAEECFREAVMEDPQSFEALVNLGGVLVTLRKLDEAMKYNLQAVLERPNDPLANAQLGMAYYLLREDELAAKYLEHTREIDPASFTYPQLILSEIRLRQGNPAAAANVLEDFLAQHPDWPQAARVREAIAALREQHP